MSGGVILLTAALLHGGSSWSSVVFHAILVTILVMVSTVKVILEADKRASVTSSADNVGLRVVKKLHKPLQILCKRDFCLGGDFDCDSGVAVR